MRGVLGFDGELARGRLDAREDAGGGEKRRERAGRGPLVRGHPPQEPVVGLVGRGDLERDQHLALQVRGGGADGLAGELGGAGKQDEADSLDESAGGRRGCGRSGRGGRAYAGEERVCGQLRHEAIVRGRRRGGPGPGLSSGGRRGLWRE